MKREHIVNEIKGIIIFSAASILLVSLLSFTPDDLSWYTSHPNVPAKNLVKIFGATVAGGAFWTLGNSAYAIVCLLFFWSWNKLALRELKFSIPKLISLLTLFCVLSSLFSMFGPQTEAMRFHRGGVAGLFISDFFVKYFGSTGSFIILITLGLLSMIVIGEFLISPFLFRLLEVIRALIQKNTDDNREKIITVKAKLRPSFQDLKEKTLKKLEQKLPLIQNGAKAKDDAKLQADFKSPLKPQIRVTQPLPKEDHPIIEEKQIIVGDYHLPSLELLKDAPKLSTSKLQEDLAGGAKILEETLAEFGVVVRVADIERGPVITRYELEPAPGVKVQQITTLIDDIALAMKAQTVRIVAPIPGKNRVGIEVPNGSSSLVYLKDVLTKSEFRGAGSKITLALGKDIAGQPLVADLASMPHLLIAGTTGAGKTVCVNSIIMSMLFNAAPHEVKFLFVDPKMVELSIYSALPHALCPAVTDPKKVSAALNWVVGEMENRYTLLAKEGVRNITSYHAKGKQMPYIVVVVDELADLMQVAAKTIEGAITRLAQLSRAVGIHLILATQRPSVDVITGVIKANFPARISFKVASKVDSRTVLDMNGADKLLGRGDMLFLKPGDAKPTRGQCCFVSDEEIQRVIDFIKAQQAPAYNENIVKQQASGVGAAGTVEGDDELYEECLRIVLETNQASVTILQRRLRLGYARAARIIDIMERNGIIGPYVGSKPRDILVNREEWLTKYADKTTNGQS